MIFYQISGTLCKISYFKMTCWFCVFKINYIKTNYRPIYNVYFIHTHDSNLQGVPDHVGLSQSFNPKRYAALINESCI